MHSVGNYSSGLCILLDMAHGTDCKNLYQVSRWKRITRQHLHHKHFWPGQRTRSTQ